jgi:hypothetical protein
MARAAVQPVAIPAAAATSAPASNREHEVAQQTRRKLLLQYAVRINHQISLLPHAGDKTDHRDTDDKGRPINKLAEITTAVKMLTVELRHEYPLLVDPNVQPAAASTETPLNVAADPLAGLRLLRFPDQPVEKPRAKNAKAAKPKSKVKAQRPTPKRDE